MSVLSRKYILSLFLVFPLLLNAQFRSFNFPKGAKEVTLPFEFHNNLIIVEVDFNGTLPLRFILDTGAEYTILTQKEIAVLFGLNSVRTYNVFGSDMKTQMTAHLVQNVSMNIGSLMGSALSMLVLEEDYWKFEALTGVDIHGIIGADILRQFVMKINYDKETITFYESAHFNTLEKEYANQMALPLTLNRNKPYIDLDLLLPQEDKHLDTHLLVDTGAGIPLLLYTNTHPDLHEPENVVKSEIGLGLGGHLEGYIGRMKEVNLGDYQLNEVLTNFQDLSEVHKQAANKANKHGIIGNVLLSRFNVTIDYFNQKMYFEPNRNYKHEFEYDKSGLSVVASGNDQRLYTVVYVAPDSPADLAGVQKGDIITSFNYFPTSLFSIDQITDKLKKKEGKSIRLKIDRAGEQHKVEFKLKKLI